MEEVRSRELHNQFQRVCGHRDTLVKREKDLQSEVDALRREDTLLEMVANLIRSLVDSEITEGVKVTEQLQSEALQAVFPDQNNSVHAEVSVKRGKVNVDLITTRTYDDGTVVEGDSRQAFGGALTTVQSVLLRITVMMRRGMRLFMVLDESVPAISQANTLRMAQFLSLLCERLGMDILVVTHDHLLIDAADHGYTISQKDGVAKLRKIR